MPPKLTIELVPATVWGSNLRSVLPKWKWDQLRKKCYRQAKYRCQICSGRGPKHPVECHEVWNYDDHQHIQRLDGLIALCPKCHEVKHLGRAHLVGRGLQARQHLQQINQWSPAECSRYINQAFDVWARRSQEQWSLDLSWLKLVSDDYNSSQSEGKAENTEE